MTTATLIYDNRSFANDEVIDIVGERRYGDILFQGQRLRDLALTAASRAGIKENVVLNSDADLASFCEAGGFQQAGFFAYHHATAAIKDLSSYQELLSKLQQLNNTAVASSLYPDFAIFCDYYELIQFLKGLSNNNPVEIKAETIDCQPWKVDISQASELLMLLSGGLKSRYFNVMEKERYTITKRSSDKTKIESEYRFYHLLPESMQRWFVLPYAYEESADGAAYQMERLNFPDISICWVHGAFKPQEYTALLDKLFEFIQQRPVQAVSEDKYRASAQKLYLDKVKQRYQQLQQHPFCSKLNHLVEGGVVEGGLDRLYERYFKLADKYLFAKQLKRQVVIGHGDLCFSNMLYEKRIDHLRFVDPKGALSEAALWIDPLYDLAKLSHSLLGNYDFIHNGQYRVETAEADNNLGLKLIINSHDLSYYKQQFIDKLVELGFDPFHIRLRELSLFLSMLPLHIDAPQRVLGFVLNAYLILQELENHDN